MTETEVLNRLGQRVQSGLSVRVGIVGLGASPESWAETAHLPALLAVPGYELRGVSASSLSSAQAGADRLGVQHAFATAGEWAAHDEIDLVVISVRVPLHEAAIAQVLGAGKLVFSEWPLGVDTAEARSLAARAAASGTPTKVGCRRDSTHRSRTCGIWSRKASSVRCSPRPSSIVGSDRVLGSGDGGRR